MPSTKTAAGQSPRAEPMAGQNDYESLGKRSLLLRWMYGV